MRFGRRQRRLLGTCTSRPGCLPPAGAPGRAHSSPGAVSSRESPRRQGRRATVTPRFSRPALLPVGTVPHTPGPRTPPSQGHPPLSCRWGRGGEFPRPCTPLTRLPEGHLQSPWAPRPQQVLPGAQLPQGQQEGLGRGVQSPEEDMWAHRNLIWSLHGARHPAFYPLGCGARPGHGGPEGCSCPRLPGGSGDGEERLAAYAQHP